MFALVLVLFSAVKATQFSISISFPNSLLPFYSSIKVLVDSLSLSVYVCTCQDYEARRCINQKVEVVVSNACYGNRRCLFLFLPACFIATISHVEWDQN